MSYQPSAVEESVSTRAPRPEILSAARKYVPWLLALLLNALLFIPSYAFSARSTFFPDPSLLKSTAQHGGVPSFVSFVFSRANLDVFRVSFDFVLLALLVIATAGTRWRTPVRRFAATYYSVLLVFLGYHHAIASFFARKPALGEDWRLLLNLGHFLAGAMSVRWFAICAGAVAGLIALPMLASYTFRLVERAAARWSRRRRALVAACFVVPCVLSLISFGVRRDAPLVQLNSKRALYNWRTSRAEAERMASLMEAEPDRRYDPLLQLSLARKPNFYLLMIEAYGEVLATWDMDPAYRALLARVEERLAAAGYHARTAYSASPVHSGTSWFAISTVHTGTLIDRPEAYDALQLVGARVPSITRFFETQGYRTYSLQPGSADHAGLRRLDLFNHDVVVDATTLDYRGWKYGWGEIPDQWSWMRFRQLWFANPPEPYYVFYMCVSTHWAWDGVPSYVFDVPKLNTEPLQPGYQDPNWPGIRQARRIGSRLRRGYFRSIEYEWRVLLDVLEADHSPNIVVAIVGDHQPGLEADMPGEVTMNTPVHILSRDKAFVDSFAENGFQPGMYAKPDAAPTLWHEGLFSLWVSKLTAAYGAPGSPSVPIYPRGIRLSTLNR